MKLDPSQTRSGVKVSKFTPIRKSHKVFLAALLALAGNGLAGEYNGDDDCCGKFLFPEAPVPVVNSQVSSGFQFIPRGVTSSALPGPVSFTNSSAIGITDCPNPCTASGQAATLYPSPITVSGVTGVVERVSITLNGFSHSFPADVDILLVSPSGRKSVIMSDFGAGSPGVSNINITLDDYAARAVPSTVTGNTGFPFTSGTYRPANSGTTDLFPGAAPAAPYTYTMSAFNGENPNGTWSLYVIDDANLDGGNISGGWTITFDARPAPPAPGSILISEFRTRGVGTTPPTSDGSADEFIELYNNTDQSITMIDAIPGADPTGPSGAGWRISGVQGATETTFVFITQTLSTSGPLVIPARGHFLIASQPSSPSPAGNTYSLSTYPTGTGITASGSANITVNPASATTGLLPDDVGLAVFSTANAVSMRRLDSVGYGSVTNPDYKEGTGLSPAAGITTAGQHSWVRKIVSGQVQDTGNNTNDFQLVDTTGAVLDGVASVLGAPGPERGPTATSQTTTNSPIFANGANNMSVTVVDPMQPIGAAPNAVYDPTPVTNGALGTIKLRAKFTNNSGLPLYTLRYRVVDIATLTGGVVPMGTADLRVLSSPASSITLTDTTSASLQALTLQTPPAQSSGGGLNSSLGQGAITTTGPLASGSSTNVEFTLGVQTYGNIQLAIIAEANNTGFVGVSGLFAVGGSVVGTGPGEFIITGPASPEIAVFNGASTAPGDERTDNTGTHDFGSVEEFSSSAAQTFTIQNTGTNNLSLGTITLSGAAPSHFSVTQPLSTTLAPTDTTTFTVTFSPTGPGVKNAVVNISSNDSDENPFEINVSGTATPKVIAPGDLIISEFRLRGFNPNGAQNEFIEVYNTTDFPITVASTDASAGFGVAASDGVARFVIPNGTVIPAHGHFLGVNSVGYALAGYAAGDTTWTLDIPDNAGIAIFSSSTTFDLTTRLDAAGSTLEANSLYREGAGYPAITPFSIDCSFVRLQMKPPGDADIANTSFTVATDGEPKDTDDNAADFYFVDTNGTSAGAGQRLGAPGPQNLSSPIASWIATPNFGQSELDTGVSHSAAPNRVRDLTSDPANNSTFGTLIFRRTFQNNTGVPLNRLRFRVLKLTTFPAPSGTSDLRPRNAPSGSVMTSGGSVSVNGTTLDQPPSQLNGGGWNSTLTAASVTPGTPLNAGDSINLEFMFGIQQNGLYRIALLAEANPGVSHLLYLTGDTENAAVSTDSYSGQPITGPVLFTGSPVVTSGGDYDASGRNLPTRELSGFTPVPGTGYTYVEVTGAANSIVGTFNDLPDGGVVAMNLDGVIYYFQADYNGGTDGNDLVLTNFTPTGPPQWKWLAGPSSRNGVGVYGNIGVAAPTNNPGARQGAVNWIGQDGSLWMFGGYGYATALTNPPRYLNDLWQYRRDLGQWVWRAGNNTPNNFGVYGTQNVEAPTNNPGSRHTPTTWTDGDGNLWLFGGYGVGTGVGAASLNDLWRYSPASGQWTWMKGSTVTGAAAVYGTQGVAAAANTPGARSSAAGVYSDGFLWLFGGYTGIAYYNDLWRYEIATGQWTWISGSNTPNQNGIYGVQGTPAAGNAPGSRRDATAWMAKDGTLWFFGGLGLPAAGPTAGDLSDLWRYDPVSGEWTWIKGVDTTNAAGVYGTLNTPAPTNLPGARSAGSGWTTIDGDFWLVGGFKNSNYTFNDVWIFDVDTEEWTWKQGAAGTLSVPGVYGTQGVAAPGNQPGGRFTPCTWVTLNGSLWIFGGGGADAFGNTGRLSDLWSYAIPNPPGAPYDNLIPAAFPDYLIVNSAPSASDETAGTMAYVPVSGRLTGTDADGDRILYSAVSSTTVSQGKLTLNTDGTWSYTPAPGFTGLASFQFRAADNYGGLSSVKTLIITVSTNPADSDGDGIADSYEQSIWGSLSAADGDGDADFDGQSNYFEFLAGTDPLNGGETFSTTPSTAGAATAEGGILIQINHVRPGVNYHLETSSDLTEWDRVGTFTFDVSGSATVEDPSPTAEGPRFYRVSIEAAASPLP